MRRLALMAMVLWSGMALAQAGAYGGIAADAVTTSLATQVPGVVEANPLGLATVPIRLALIEHTKSLPPEQAKPVLDAITASSIGVSVNNLLILAGVGAAPVVGLIVGMTLWDRGAEEREFWFMCAEQRRDQPQLTCRYTKP
jgi:hypothetical protein